MNKQELIEKLKKRLATGIAYDTSFTGTLKFAINLAEQLDEVKNVVKKIYEII